MFGNDTIHMDQKAMTPVRRSAPISLKPYRPRVGEVMPIPLLL
jgi:hypothetical protein